jgi:hypothetical protein
MPVAFARPNWDTSVE